VVKKFWQKAASHVVSLLRIKWSHLLLIDSPVFVQLTRVTNTQTHIHTDHAACDICNNGPYLMHCVRQCGLIIIRMMMMMMMTTDFLPPMSVLRCCTRTLWASAPFPWPSACQYTPTRISHASSVTLRLFHVGGVPAAEADSAS